jgi:drug/metabolite transporter (DMT)-like permease
MTVPSAHGGIVLALLPLATAAAAVIFAGERPFPAFWLFAALGSAIVLAYALHESHLQIVAGDIYLLLSVVVAAIGYAISGRLARTLPGWEVISWALVFGLPVTIGATILFWPHDLAAVPLPAWLGVAYVAVMSQYVGFWAWNAALAMGGVARISQVQLLQPFVTFVLSALVLGETISPEMIGFALAVVAVVALGRRAAVKGPLPPEG